MATDRLVRGGVAGVPVAAPASARGPRGRGMPGVVRIASPLRRALVACSEIVCAASIASCGYRAAYGGGAGDRRWHVAIVRADIADASAADEVAIGVREELARDGMLASGNGFPRVAIEVLREDHVSEGIRAPIGGGATPLARAIDVGVVARAWIARSVDATPELDTGDIRADASMTERTGGATADPRGAIFDDADGVRAAARRLGHKLAARLLGRGAMNETPFNTP